MPASSRMSRSNRFDFQETVVGFRPGGGVWVDVLSAQGTSQEWASFLDRGDVSEGQSLQGDVAESGHFGGNDDHRQLKGVGQKMIEQMVGLASEHVQTRESGAGNVLQFQERLAVLQGQ